MKLIIRNTIENEFFHTENITREAFWNLYAPGCDEHLVLHQLRKSKSYIKELDLVAVTGDRIIGHVISTKARVVNSSNIFSEVLCLGPVSVLPEFQQNGVGSKLINSSVTEAKKLGFSGIILFGNPYYYHRFGFRNAAEFEITTKDGENFEPFMALELFENGLKNSGGKFFEDEAFLTSEADLNDFEKLFPAKEKGTPKINLNH